MRSRYLNSILGVLAAATVALMGGWSAQAKASASSTWRALPPAPIAGRMDASTLWTGREMIVWGGVSRGAHGQASARSDGAAYDPATGKWRRIADAPAGVLGGGGSAAAWTGSRMVVYVGNSPDGPAAAAAYDPRRNTWTRLPTGLSGSRS